MTGGYDHNFVLDKPEGAFDWMAKAYCEKTGIAMEAYTDCPAVQFYAANFVNGEKEKMARYMLNAMHSAWSPSIARTRSTIPISHSLS